MKRRGDIVKGSIEECNKCSIEYKETKLQIDYIESKCK